MNTIALDIPSWKLAEVCTAGESLLLAAREVTIVTSAPQQSLAASRVSNIRKHLNAIESMRKDLTAPLLNAQRQLKQMADDDAEPLQAELRRIEALVTQFQIAERKRCEEEERQRKAEFERLEKQRQEQLKKAQAEDNLQKAIELEAKAEALEAQSRAVITAPAAAPAKAGGIFATKTELKFEVLDIEAVYKARPDLCFPPTIKPSAVKAVCTDKTVVPGLKLWNEERTVSRAR